ncbi:MAG TPA: ankyrin repeat domain-containing protein, partial [Acidobacteriota bacterium]|nr:ankyrin repeat domain-containing protein [Acidobacteriota bacterium]
MSTEFFEAIKKGEGERVDQMLGADGSLASASNEQGVSAPLFALYNQQFEIADRIAAARDDLNVFEAAALGDVDRLKGLVNELPQRAVEPSSDGFCPLHLACFFGRVEAARYLIDQDVDVDRPTSNPMEIRPLHSAFANRDAQS